MMTINTMIAALTRLQEELGGDTPVGHRDFLRREIDFTSFPRELTLDTLPDGYRADTEADTVVVIM